MTISARSEHPRGARAARHLRERARQYLAALRQGDAELSILVVDDRAMRRLNRAWRGCDRATDVLSFPHHGPAAELLLGDVVISLDTARRAARSAGRTLGAELDRYLAHGLLHLLGHDHHRPADARRMSAAEDALVGEGMVREAGKVVEASTRSGSGAGTGSTRPHVPATLRRHDPRADDPRTRERGRPRSTRRARSRAVLVRVRVTRGVVGLGIGVGRRR